MFSCTTAQHIYCTNTVQLYSLQLNCTYSNYTEAAATCSAAQQHTNCPSDVFWSVCSWLFDILRMYYHIERLEQNKNFIRLTPLRISEHYSTHSYVPSWPLRAVYVPSRRKGMTKFRSVAWSVITWAAGVNHILIPSVWRKVRTASASLCHLLSNKHFHWITPQASCGANSKCFQGAFQRALWCVSGVMWGHLQLVFQLVGLEWCAVATVFRYLWTPR